MLRKSGRIIILVGMLAALAVPTAADDLGVMDTLALEVSIEPCASRGGLNVALEAWVFNDSNQVFAVSAGWTWNNPNMTMTEAVPSDLASSSFDVMIFYDQTSLDSTNLKHRFTLQAVNFGSSKFGVPAGPERRLWVTYNFTLSEWGENDVIFVRDTIWNDGTELQFNDYPALGLYFPYFNTNLEIHDNCIYEGPVWYVSPTGSDLTGDGSSQDPFATIQFAVDSAAHGDTVMVTAGTYTGDGNRDIRLRGKSLTLMSESGPASTVIDCQGSELDPHRGFYIYEGEDSTTIISGLTVTGGYVSSALESGWTGGAVYVESASPGFVDCRFVDNRVVDGGGGSGGAAGIFSVSTSRFEGCLFAGNSADSGGAVCWQGTLPKFDNCTFVANSADTGSVFWFYDDSLYLNRCILAFNEGSRPVISSGDGGQCAVSCTDIFGNAVGDWIGLLSGMDAVNGNMSRDPYFCDTSAGDYSIDSLSPCAPYHPDNDCDHLIGALPPGCAVLADSDGDFVPDGLDNCPSTANHDQNDYDSDGVGDVCDNCPATPNLDQSNTDGDALGDACDPGEVLFSTDRQCGGAPLTVNFTDESVPLRPISSWFWDFGDNESSTEQNPQHQYQASGVYTVQLFITDDQGNLDSLIVDDCVAVLDSIVADFIALPASGAPPLTVAFDPNLDGIANTFFWDFGDGQTSTEENPIHVYNTVGRYSVRLKVGLSMDECAFEDSVIKQDYVAVKDLRAYFQGSPRAGVDPLTVQFSDLSSGSPVQWRWDFGDGGTSTFQNPSHQYTLPGVYDVSLWVSDGMFTDSLKRLGHVHVDTAWADLSLTISDIGARPGFPIYFFYEYQNSGTVAATNTFIRMVPPEGVTSFATYWAPELPYEWVGDTLIVDLGTVEPGDDTTVIARGILSEYTPIGEILHVQGWITTDTLDVDQDNNYYEHLVEVTGSIDPNDKKVSPDGTGPQHYLAAEQRLSYIIQFENKPEATAEAIYVRIVDTLDPDLDWSTLALGAISHPDKCKSYFDPYSGVLSWVCDSIMLPPNNTPPEGEGYVKFSISPKADLPLETQISNTAWIRFDYNAWLRAPETGAVIRTIKPPSCCGLYTSGYTGNADCSSDGRLTLADITRLIDRIYISGIELCCDENGNVDGSLDDRLSLNDITYLIDHVYLTHVPTAPCP